MSVRKDPRSSTGTNSPLGPPAPAGWWPRSRAAGRSSASPRSSPGSLWDSVRSTAGSGCGRDPETQPAKIHRQAGLWLRMCQQSWALPKEEARRCRLPGSSKNQRGFGADSTPGHPAMSQFGSGLNTGGLLGARHSCYKISPWRCPGGVVFGVRWEALPTPLCYHPPPLAQQHSISSAGHSCRGRGCGSVAQACPAWRVADTGHIHL